MNYNQDVNFEDIIKKIVEKTGLSRDEILNRIDEAIQGAGGLITRAGAALILAENLKIDIDLNNTLSKDRHIENDDNDGYTILKISDLLDGMKNINIAGRIIRINNPRSFTRNDGRVGKVASLILKDKTGEIRIVLWDKKVSLIEDGLLKPGEIIGVYNGYIKKGINGNLEVNVGNKGMIKANPDNIDESDIPELETNNFKIAELSENLNNFTVVAKLLNKFPVRTFEYQNSKRKVANAIIADETGSINLTFWHEQISKYDKLRVGEVYEFSNLRTKLNEFRGELELNTTNFTEIKKSDKNINVQIEGSITDQKTMLNEATVINDFSNIQENMNNIVVKGTVAQKLGTRTWSKNGRTGMVGRAILQDSNQKTVTLVFWTSNIKDLDDLNVGDVVEINNIYTKKNFNGLIELHLKNNSNVKKIGSGKISIKKFKIAELKEKQSLISLDGKITGFEEERQVVLRDGTTARVMNFTIADDTGTINAVVWRDLVDKVKSINVGDCVHVERVNTRFNSYTNQLELSFTSNSVIEKIEGNDFVTVEVSRPVENKTTDAFKEKETKEYKISEILDGQNNVTVKGRIVKIEMEKEVSLKDGTRARVINFIVADDTGSIYVVAWRSLVDEIKKFKEGDTVLVKNAKARFNRFSDRIEISLSSLSTIEAIDDDEDLPPLDEIKKDLKLKKHVPIYMNDDRIVLLKNIQDNQYGDYVGYITHIQKQIRHYLACPTCNKKVNDDDGVYSCTLHGAIEKPEIRLILRVFIDDGTGTIPATLIGNNVERLLGINDDDKERIINGTQDDDDDFIEELSRNLLFRKFLFRGRVKYNQFRNEFELVMDRFQELDLNKKFEDIVTNIETA
ncbi:MAG: OB-fold nucleic acid binding domain-containing protein [Promethearchaeota archaeon]